MTDTYSILILLSAWSFVPQLRLLWLRRESIGLSLAYLLFTTVSATEQLTLGLHLILVEPESFLHHQPRPNVNDWLNVVQFLVVWIEHIFL